MKTKKKDAKLVSSETHELRKVARKMKVPISAVMMAKEQTRSSKRSTIEAWILAHEIFVMERQGCNG